MAWGGTAAPPASMGLLLAARLMARVCGTGDMAEACCAVRRGMGSMDRVQQCPSADCWPSLSHRGEGLPCCTRKGRVQEKK